MKSKKWILSCAIMLALISIGSQMLLRGQVSREVLRVINLKFTPPNGTAISACVIEGGMLKITNLQTGTGFAYFPTVQDEKEGVVSVRVYKVTNSGAGENMEEVETIESSFKAANSTSKSPVYSIAVETLGKTSAPDNANKDATGSTPTNAAEGMAAGECCVTCNGINYCSNCRVYVPGCGSCCTGSPRACMCGPGGGN